MAQTGLIVWEVVDNPIDCLEKVEGRIIAFHLKHVAEWGRPVARDVPQRARTTSPDRLKWGSIGGGNRGLVCANAAFFRLSSAGRFD